MEPLPFFVYPLIGERLFESLWDTVYAEFHRQNNGPFVSIDVDLLGLHRQIPDLAKILDTLEVVWKREVVLFHLDFVGKFIILLHPPFRPILLSQLTKGFLGILGSKPVFTG